MSKKIEHRHPAFRIDLDITTTDFVKPPDPSQRNWILRRSLGELADDLLRLDEVSKRFVRGGVRPQMGRHLAARDTEFRQDELVIDGQQVMHRWADPLMREMAAIVGSTHGDVLEIGFGMGLSASYIQDHGVRSHTIIECSDGVRSEFEKWKEKYADRDIRLVLGTWQERLDELGEFDAILFDTYPLSEDEFVRYVLEDVTFAAHFFAPAARHLRKGGVFTYYTNEIDCFGRQHQRRLLEHFKSITLSVVNGLEPPQDGKNWWADSMVTVAAIR